MRGKGAQKISRDKRGRASKAMWIFSEGEGSIFDVFGNPSQYQFDEMESVHLFGQNSLGHGQSWKYLICLQKISKL